MYVSQFHERQEKILKTAFRMPKGFPGQTLMIRCLFSFSVTFEPCLPDASLIFWSSRHTELLNGTGHVMEVFPDGRLICIVLYSIIANHFHLFYVHQMK